ncbi:hypothetical protein N8J89_26000 [Crossiella sp. CA-258035]|uniref:hypothetical protein n=1 Tax=Crossiella sp. CA-258035 TaxID=2981138 RepID=UPI0024BBFB17|nr:hypothetical protein [Crossiella sp. CA-258035]WHT16580.1 hypothetical protein N8J89_26000 [Crossiella sp. CA-258035]
MSPATITGFNSMLPTESHPSPGERFEHTGPGWSSTAFYAPWHAGPPTPKYRWSMFDTAAQAVGDLVRCLDDGFAGEQSRQAARVLLDGGPPGELVLSVSLDWVCVVYQVRPGVHLSDAADAFFAGWRNAMFDRRFELINANRPMIC